MQMEPQFVKLYQYQIVRGLNFMHGHGIALCDFGTAKRLNFCEPRQLYICSRYFRAPEIIFGSTNYNCSIDLWGAGCILAEMIIGQPLFAGANGIHQGVEIIKVLGTPTNDDLRAMNPNYPKDYNFRPALAKIRWEDVLRNRTSDDGCDLVDHLVRFDPNARLPPKYCMLHRYFDALRASELNGITTPLFNFVEDE